MERIQIEGEFDRSWVISLMAEGMNTYQILVEYGITEDLILECQDLFEKEVLFQGINFSEEFIRKGLESNYLTTEDLENLSMTTYSNLSESFIGEYSEQMNWTKILIYQSTQTDSFTKYIDIIEKNNLWKLISANDLPTDFIRKYKEKLDWQLLSIVKCFTDDEKEEFSSFVVETKNEVSDNMTNQFVSIEDIYEKNYSVDEIADLIDKYMSEINQDFWVKNN